MQPAVAVTAGDLPRGAAVKEMTLCPIHFII